MKQCPACKDQLHFNCKKCGAKCWCYMTTVEVEADRKRESQKGKRRASA